MNKIKKGDEVIIRAGRDKGRRGVVLRVISDKKTGKVERVLVESINMVHKHVRANPQRNIEGGILRKEAPIHISNVAIYNPVTEKADYVGIKVVDGKKKRYFKSNNEIIDV